MANRFVQLNRSYAVAGSRIVISAVDYLVDNQLRIAVDDSITDEVLASLLGPALADAGVVEVTAPINPEAMTLVLGSAAANADLTLTAKTKGVLVPAPTIRLHNTGLTNAESIETTDRDIVVTLATTSGVSTSTANSVKATIDGDTEGAAALVTVAVEGSGAGLVDAFETPQPLTGGVNGTGGLPGDILFAEGNFYGCIEANTWKLFTITTLP